MTDTLSITDIMTCLPHRYPFLLLDRVQSMETGKKIVAIKNVTINEPFFMGHFPKTPIMPGVLIVEAMAQAGGVLVIAALPPEQHGSPVYFMGMDKVRFRKPVIPGDRLTLEVELLKSRPKAVKMSGVAIVDGVRVAEAEMMAMIGEKS